MQQKNKIDFPDFVAETTGFCFRFLPIGVPTPADGVKAVSVGVEICLNSGYLVGSV